MYGSHKFHNIVNYFSFKVLKKKILTNFQRIIELFTQKIVSKFSKIWVWDPGSGKIYSGSRIQGSKRHRIPDPQHWVLPLCEMCDMFSLEFHKKTAITNALR
jgi:hypothetical protein